MATQRQIKPAEALRLFLNGDQDEVSVKQAKKRLGKNFDEYVREVYSYKKRRYKYRLTLEGEILLMNR